jgi:3-hydroxyacyl-[acyl-carrier-protein] dehydratase
MNAEKLSTKALVLPLGIEEIQGCIPHRYPFLLVDKVIELVPNESIVAIKNISMSDPILQGHFPNFPVFPGVLMIEGMAQASAILGRYSREQDFHQVLLTEISECRFRHKVVPGDQLRFEVSLEKKREPFFWFKGTVVIDGRSVASATFSALMK